MPLEALTMLTSRLRQFLPIIFLSALWSVAAGCTHCPRCVPSSCPLDVVTSFSPAVPAGTLQLVVVLQAGSDKERGEVFLFERRSGEWVSLRGPLPAMVGRSGFARIGEKREGDGRTPSGLYTLESAFGYAATAATKMDYRQATDDDLWVDDAASPDYNRWVKRGETAALSFEVMRRDDHRYRYGLVTGYNRSPVIPGLGSAIFVHVWLRDGISTSGCIALSEPDLLDLLGRLDPVKKPMILMGRPDELLSCFGCSSLPESCRQGEP